MVQIERQILLNGFPDDFFLTTRYCSSPCFERESSLYGLVTLVRGSSLAPSPGGLGFVEAVKCMCCMPGLLSNTHEKT